MRSQKKSESWFFGAGLLHWNPSSLMANTDVSSVRGLGLGTCHTVLELSPCLTRTVHASRAANPLCI